MLNKDFKEFAALFRSRQARIPERDRGRLCLGGIWASALYGRFGFWIGTDEANARKLAK
jgi:hypothetical protein